MPILSLTYNGANGQPHDWSHVQTPLDEIKTFLNNTGIDYANVQQYGLRVDRIRAYAGVLSGPIKVRNASGGTLNANDLIYFSGTYSDGTDNYPTITKAIVTDSNATTFYAQGIVDSSILNNADGVVYLTKEVGSLNTTGLSVGQRTWLSTVAGAYLTVLPAPNNRVQVVGMVSVVSATVGKIIFGNWSIIPFSIADQI